MQKENDAAGGAKFHHVVFRWDPEELCKAKVSPYSAALDIGESDQKRDFTFGSRELYYRYLANGVLFEIWGILSSACRTMRSENIPLQLVDVQQGMFGTTLGFKMERTYANGSDCAALSHSVVVLRLGNKLNILGLSGPVGNSSVVRIKVEVDTDVVRQLAASITQGSGITWRACSLRTSVVSHQRMYDAALRQSNVPFLSSLLRGAGGIAISDTDPPASIGSRDTTSTVSATPTRQLKTTLNATQIQAITPFLQSTDPVVHCIEGPPGTGKTRTIAALISALIGQGHRCLVTASSNKAVSVVATQFHTQIQSGPSSGIAVAILRSEDRQVQAQISDPEPHLAQYAVDTWGKIKCEAIQDIQSQLKEWRVTVDTRTREHPEPIRTQETQTQPSCEAESALLSRCSGALLALQKSIRKCGPTIDNKASLSEGLKAAAACLAQAAGLAAAETKGGAHRGSKGPHKGRGGKFNKREHRKEQTINLGRKQTQSRRLGPSDGKADLIAPAMKGTELSSGVRKLNLNDEKGNPDPKSNPEEGLPFSNPDLETGVLNPKSGGNGDAARIREVLTQMVDKVDRATTHLTQVQTALAKPYDAFDLVNHAQAVFATLSTLGGWEVVQKMRAVDVLIVDEASQTTEAETCIAFQFQPKRLCFIGDTKQLPPTVFTQATVSKISNTSDTGTTVVGRDPKLDIGSNGPKIELGFGRSAMSRLVDGCRYPCARLTTQYRMHPQIARFPSERFYEGSLINARTKDLVQPWHRFLGPYAFINCPKGTEIKTGRSYKNQAEVEMCLKLVEQLETRFAVAPANQIALITFYQGQVQALNEAFAQAKGGYKGVCAYSVDSYQGSEQDIVILSTVRSNRAQAIGFLDDFRRLNVALTRARHTLIVVGHQDTLCGVKGSDMRCMVEDAMARKVVYNAQEVLLAIKKGHDQLQRTVEGSHCAESIVSIGNGASGAHAPSLSLDEDDVDDWEARDDSSEDVDSWESRA